MPGKQKRGPGTQQLLEKGRRGLGHNNFLKREKGALERAKSEACDTITTGKGNLGVWDSTITGEGNKGSRGHKNYWKRKQGAGAQQLLKR